MSDNFFYKGEQPAFITNSLERLLHFNGAEFKLKAYAKKSGGDYEYLTTTGETYASNVDDYDAQFYELYQTIPRDIVQCNLPLNTEEIVFDFGTDYKIQDVTGNLLDPEIPYLSSVKKPIPYEYMRNINALAFLGHNFSSMGVETIIVEIHAVQYNINTNEGTQLKGNLKSTNLNVLANGAPAANSSTFKTIEDGYTIIELSEINHAHNDANYVPINNSTGQHTDNQGNVYTEPYLLGFRFRLICGFGSGGAQPLLGPARVSSIIVGSYYNAPSPNLEYSLTYENDRYQVDRGLSGIDFITSKSSKKGFQFMQGEPTKNFFADDFLALDGRKSYSMSFSFIQNKDMFPGMTISSKKYNANYVYKNFNILDTGTTSSGDFAGEYLVDDISESGDINQSLKTNFYVEIITNTMNTMLPFIYIHNVNAVSGTNTNSLTGDVLWDQFDICRFTSNSIELEHVSHNLFNVSLEYYSVY